MVYFLIVAAVVAAVAAWTDSRTGHIPNWLTFGAFTAALLAHLIVSWELGGWRAGLWGLGYAAGGALLCGIVPAFMYWRGGMGGGDLKLFVALGAMCQPLAGLEMETYAFLAAALIAPARLAYKGVLFRTLGASLSLLLNPFRKEAKRREVPPDLMTWFRLGPAIFLGAATTVLLHWDFP